jgi:hypothetical protein
MVIINLNCTIQANTNLSFLKLLNRLLSLFLTALMKSLKLRGHL